MLEVLEDVRGVVSESDEIRSNGEPLFPRVNLFQGRRPLLAERRQRRSCRQGLNEFSERDPFQLRALVRVLGSPIFRLMLFAAVVNHLTSEASRERVTLSTAHDTVPPVDLVQVQPLPHDGLDRRPRIDRAHLQ